MRGKRKKGRKRVTVKKPIQGLYLFQKDQAICRFILKVNRKLAFNAISRGELNQGMQYLCL